MLLKHRSDIFWSGLVIQVFCGELEGVQETFNVICWLFFQDLYASLHVDLGGLVEGSVGMDVVVQDDDSNHHSHTEQQRVLTVEPARVVWCLQHDFADAGHGAENVSGVLQG